MLFWLALCLAAQRSSAGGLHLRGSDSVDLRTQVNGTAKHLSFSLQAERPRLDRRSRRASQKSFSKRSSQRQRRLADDLVLEALQDSGEWEPDDHGEGFTLGEEEPDNLMSRVTSCGNASLAEYLAQIYNKCRQVRSVRDQLPYMDSAELQERYSKPVLSYSPWVTSLPVIYITGGGPREKKFKGLIKHFSPTLFRVQAFVPTNDTDAVVKEMDTFVDKPNETVEHVRYRMRPVWKKVLGCLLSHLKAIHLAWKAKMSTVIILEDDALPMYPSWRTTLEEFVLTLPSDWQAVQLQWTAGRDSTVKLNHTNVSQPWVHGRAWGTAAYLLSRRAMSRLRSQLWNKTSGRWRLKKLQHCLLMSADDCLLGFTNAKEDGNMLKSFSWFPAKTGNKTLALTKVYLGTPSIFLHDSQLNPLHIRNYCEDIKENTRLLQHHPVQPGAERLLIFFAVNSSRTRNMSGLQDSVQYLRQSGYNIFLVYDDAKRTAASASARKLRALWLHWRKFRKSWRRRYDYIWAVDEDVPLKDVSLVPALASLLESNASIAAPAIIGSSPSAGDTPVQRLQRQEAGCKFRYTNHIEGVAPIFKTEALDTIFEHFQGDSHRGRGPTTALGHWCSVLQSTAEAQKPCALLDGFPLARNSTVDRPTSDIS